MAAVVHMRVSNTLRRVLPTVFLVSPNKRNFVTCVVSMASAADGEQQTTRPVGAADKDPRNSSSLVSPPLAKRRQSSVRVHGREVLDHYAWLQDVKNKEVLQYLGQENRYFQHVMKETGQLQRKFVQEMATLDKPPGKVPQIIDGYVYYDKMDTKSLPIHCRHKEGCPEDEEVVVDLNVVAAAYGQPYVNITTLKISPSQELVAFVIETPDSDIYDTQIWKIGKPSPSAMSHHHHHTHSGTCSHGSHGHEKSEDKQTCEELRSVDEEGDFCKQLEVIHNVFSVEWLAEDVLMYTSASKYVANQVWLHTVGTRTSEDNLIYKEQNERYFVDISFTKDKKYITINSSTKTSSEVRLFDCDPPDSPVVLVQPRVDGMEYFIEHSNGTFYILTNKDRALDYKLMKVSSAWDLSMDHWQDVYVPEASTKITDMDVFDSHCVLSVKVNSVPALTVIPLQCPSQLTTLQLPGNISSIRPEDNPNFNSTCYKLSVSSPCMPPTEYQLDLKVSQLTPVQGKASNLDNSNYTCERHFATSKDGTRVPMTLFRRADLKLDGSNPMLVYGYGAYGDDLEVGFKPERLMLLNRGWVLAFAHVRGGSELGRHWYYKARQSNKHRSFEDFEACLEHLHELGYSQSKLTAACGTSAGGLLVAGVCNRSPHLLKTAILKVPFVDVLNTMLQPSLPLTLQDYEEWGNPEEDEGIFTAIQSYCPYQNINNQIYPSTLVTASMNDIRVPFWTPLKYVAKRRHFAGEAEGDQSQLHVVLQFDGTGGHFDDDSYEQTALECAFLHKTLGIPLH